MKTIEPDQQYYITMDGANYQSCEGYIDSSPYGLDLLKQSIEELKDAESVEDEDISIFVLTKLKVKTHRVVEIIEGD